MSFYIEIDCKEFCTAKYWLSTRAHFTQQNHQTTDLKVVSQREDNFKLFWGKIIYIYFIQFLCIYILYLFILYIIFFIKSRKEINLKIFRLCYTPSSRPLPLPLNVQYCLSICLFNNLSVSNPLHQGRH